MEVIFEKKSLSFLKKNTFFVILQQTSLKGCLASENNFDSKTECINFCWDFLDVFGRQILDNTTILTDKTTHFQATLQTINSNVTELVQIESDKCQYSECNLTCPQGRKINLNGCEMCTCVDLCQNKTCDMGHKCVVENSNPICKPIKTTIKPGNYFVINFIIYY
jgi:hypothetical protein